MTEIATLDRLPEQDFVTALGGIFEHSPWIAAAVASRRPFGTIDALHAAMVAAVASAPAERQLALLKAHPELAGKLARSGALTEASFSEQASVGLDRLDEATIARFDAVNRQYAKRFGFPFIIAVKGQRDWHTILEAMQRRTANDATTEFTTALAEVYTIARFRLDALADRPLLSSP